ncbi:MAG: hypothetical protein UT24_C0030G0020 [Candidatus Woesebacteria bacterium GW2011_GWB1_39_12]|uniref:Uncharacterized protein n=1 Tax=Candidatus Woesebacteria bacterium GW2011_GWB1_39_12 TaxID=1618574 RepID=A0A0G0M6S6_9BACT|nr:MAG: hypothetical protein UT24_C0030G0020 [Candidatus Woesebacteria bacterium GW2011_GWB1_39_12]
MIDYESLKELNYIVKWLQKLRDVSYNTLNYSESGTDLFSALTDMLSNKIWKG